MVFSSGYIQRIVCLLLFLTPFPSTKLFAQQKTDFSKEKRAQIAAGIVANPDSMLSVLRPMLEKYKAQDDKVGQAITAYGLGTIYKSRYLFDSMYFYLDFCLANTQERQLRSAALYKIYLYFLKRAEFALARKYAYEILSLYPNPNSEEESNKVLPLVREIVSLWKDDGSNPDSTIKWVEYGMRLQEKYFPDSLFTLHGLRFHHASALQGKGEFLKAFEIYLEIRDFMIKNNVKIKPSDSVRIYYRLAQTSSSLNLSSLSENYIDSCLLIINNSLSIRENFSLINKIFDQAAMQYIAAGDERRALDIQKRHITLKDSIMEWKRQELTVEAEARYNTTNYELRNRLLNSSLDEQKQQNNIYILLSLSLLLMVGLAFFIFMQIRVKLKYKEKELENNTLKINLQEEKIKQKEIENSLQKEKLKQKEIENTLQEKQLSGMVTEALRHSEQVEYISTRLKDAQKDHSQINKVLKEVRNFQSSEQEWENMKVHFEDVHKSFFDKVLQRAPNLTRLNFRMCVYMRMNLSDKEIALLTRSSPRTLSVRRYRLRKQLGFESNKELVDFLRSI